MFESFQSGMMLYTFTPTPRVCIYLSLVSIWLTKKQKNELFQLILRSETLYLLLYNYEIIAHFIESPFCKSQFNLTFENVKIHNQYRIALARNMALNCNSTHNCVNSLVIAYWIPLKNILHRRRHHLHSKLNYFNKIQTAASVNEVMHHARKWMSIFSGLTTLIS